MRNLTPAKLTLIMFVMVGGLIAAYVGKRLFAVEERPPVVQTRNLPMPVADIEPGTMISAEHLGMGPVRNEQLESDMLLSNRVIVGRVAKEKIPAARPIRAGQLYQPGERPPLEVAESMRAVSIAVGDAVSLVDGLIRPGEYVDVHLTPEYRDRDPRLRGGLTLTLFKGVKVLAINRETRMSRLDRLGNSITVELTPEQANIMILAREAGLITCTYNPDGKGDGGVAVGTEDRAYLEEVLGLVSDPEPAPPFSTEVYRRGSRDEIYFRDGKRVNPEIGGNTRPQTSPPATPAPAAPSTNDDVPVTPIPEPTA